MNLMARRMFELVEPIGLIPYSADEPNEARFAVGFTNYWDTYFAGRAAPLRLVAAEVVDALFLQLRRERRSPLVRRLREGAAANPRRSRRHSRLRPRHRTAD